MRMTTITASMRLANIRYQGLWILYSLILSAASKASSASIVTAFVRARSFNRIDCHYLVPRSGSRRHPLHATRPTFHNRRQQSHAEGLRIEAGSGWSPKSTGVPSSNFTRAMAHDAASMRLAGANSACCATCISSSLASPCRSSAMSMS